MAPSNTVRSDTSSTRSPDSTDPQLNQRIWLEVGHTYERRYWKSGRAVPEDWRVWVRGVAGADITALIDKVVFRLCPDTQFPFPKRICLEAPFELEEAGSAPTEIIIDVHLKCGTKPEKIQLKYGSLFDKAEESRANSRCVFYDVQKLPEQPRMKLPQTIAEVFPRSRTQQAAFANHDVTNKKFVEPIEPLLSHKQMLLFEGCALCDKAESGGSICPLLLSENASTPDHSKMSKLASSPTAKKLPKIKKSLSPRSVYKTLNERCRKLVLKESVEPSGSARRHCRRCLTRVTPCPSCQPRRVPKLPLM